MDINMPRKKRNIKKKKKIKSTKKTGNFRKWNR